MKVVSFWAFIFLLNVSLHTVVQAQKPASPGAADIIKRLEKLQVLGNALYVAAHPDDENTRLITYFANGLQLNTGYFSFTRGDGGQNLIGPEIREALGVIRTQELLAARRIDHGRQFFSRAVDFGYSKHPDETLQIWDESEVLADLVYVIRKFKPDIIVNRFNNQPGTTHGHHTASAILAEKAFKIAGDPDAFPEQLEYVDPWSPHAIYWNTYWWRRSDYEKDTAELVKYNIGAYDPILGKSYSEIAAESRSMHKSQGFGATGQRGDTYEYLQQVDGPVVENDAFEDIDLTWGRVEGGEEIERAIDVLISVYDPRRPDQLIPGLIDLRKMVNNITDEYWKKIKMEEVDALIYACLGLYVEAVAADYTACQGEAMNIEFELINRTSTPVYLKELSFPGLDKDSTLRLALTNNLPINFETEIHIPADAAISQPYWLRKPGTLGMFEVEEQQLRGQPENAPAVVCQFAIEVLGEQLEFLRPVIYKTNDPVKGETYRPFAITPPVFANFPQPVNIFSNEQSKLIPIRIIAGRDSIEGRLKLRIGAGWGVAPEFTDFKIDGEGGEQLVHFRITPPAGQDVQTCRLEIEMNGHVYNHSLEEIEYDHIPYQLLFPEAQSKFVRIDLQKKGALLGYVMGAGDDIPVSLREIGYQVEIINDMDFTPENLDRFDAVLLGVRAFNTVDRLKFDFDHLLDYVKRGGNLLVQYNTNFRMVRDQIAPYPLEISRDRVTVEEAEIRIIDPDHPILNYPNRITHADFDGWVQERGLYFPNEWSEEFDAVLSTNDPGEEPLDGGVLVAPYGDGYFVYTSFSWFRELPAGVPGAFRIFANLISIGK